MATITKNVLALTVREMLQSNEDEFPLADLEKQAEAALQRYSVDRPDDVTADISGDGGKYYPVSSLSAWVGDFSQVRAIEYPAQPITDDETPQYLDAEDWDDDYWDGSTQYIFLPNHAPAATESMRIRYTAPYQFNSSGVAVVPTADYWAIVYLLTSLACRAIAVKYARTTDAIINADSVDHAGRSERFRTMASDYLRQYKELIGLRSSDDGGTAVQGTGTFVDLDTDPTWPTGRRYLFHGRDTR